ncbi:hypothetical protein [Rubritalea marina]|uniref:hypothetical protein n=1 Tax=Rubritalea marina TaxID=361055 RepID=UPI000382AFFB|nr:hypothetical protein [Rubritalea marina]
MFGKLIVCGVALLVLGVLRLPLERRLSAQLKEDRVMAPSFDAEARAGLSQKAWIASFGSLRPALAAYYSLGVIRYHSGRDWEGLEERLEEVVLLDPYNPFYWNTGAWHLAYNAAADVHEDASLAPLQRKQGFREWIARGDALYQRGIEANPDDLKLRLERARLWSNPHRILDYPKVLGILQSCLDDLELTDARIRRIELDQCYAMLRIPGEEQSAYQLARRLYLSDVEGAPSSLRNGLCALQLHPNVIAEPAIPIQEIYGSRANAVKLLTHYLKDSDPDKPRYGVRDLLDALGH